MHLDLGFRVWENFWGFCAFAKNFGLGFVFLLSLDQALYFPLLFSHVHAFLDCVLVYIL